jgi:hypothetical protein
MKIASLAVASLVCLPYSTAFVGPQFAKKSLVASKLKVHDNGEGEVPGWVRPASVFAAGLTVAAQVAGASVDFPAQPVSSLIQVASGKFNSSYSSKSHHRSRVNSDQLL